MEYPQRRSNSVCSVRRAFDNDLISGSVACACCNSDLLKRCIVHRRAPWKIHLPRVKKKNRRGHRWCGCVWRHKLECTRWVRASGEESWWLWTQQRIQSNWRMQHIHISRTPFSRRPNQRGWSSTCQYGGGRLDSKYWSPYQGCRRSCVLKLWDIGVTVVLQWSLKIMQLHNFAHFES